MKSALIVAAAGLYSAVAVAVAPWTWYSRIFTALAGLAALGYALRLGHHRAGAKDTFQADGMGTAGYMIWTLLITVTAGWVLAIFFSQPRAVYPTLSHLMNIIFADYPTRVAGFFAWLALGWYLLRR